MEKIKKKYLQEFIEEKVEPILQPFLAGEIEINYEGSKGSAFIVKTPSEFNIEPALFGPPHINFHASHAQFHKFGIPKGLKDGMQKVGCFYNGDRFYLLFKFVKGDN